MEGIDRSQSSLFPAELEDYVAEDNLVRAVDAFVDGLDLGKLGFGRVAPLERGRPCYHPATLLKIYIYGYLNRVPSSRRLERECQRNIELIWLTGHLAPDFKTIADFRKDNGKAIREVCRSFVAVCRDLDLLSEASVAIDGSNFKAVNARDRLHRGQDETASGADRGEHRALHGAIGDCRPPWRWGAAGKGCTVQGQNRETERRDSTARCDQCRDDEEQGQANLAFRYRSAFDGDERRTPKSSATMCKPQSIPRTVIVAHEVTNVGTDRHQLSDLAEQARTEMGVEKLDAVADRGYYASEEIRACEEAGITVTLPKPMTSNAKAAGRFGKQDFVYIAADDVYICPARERLTSRATTNDAGKVIRRYWTSACRACALKSKCTPETVRRVSRWEHEAVLKTVQARLDHHPEKMTIRRQTAEHPFGTIKCWMGATHFLTKRLPKVATEMALNVLAYNIKRVMAIIGVAGLLEALAT